MLNIHTSANTGELSSKEKDLAASLPSVNDEVTASQLSPISEHSPGAINCKSAEDHATLAEDSSSSIQQGMYGVLVDAIPTSLQAIPNWVDWRLEQNAKGKLTKIPYVVGNQQKAASDNPQSWRGVEDVVKGLSEDHGIGWMLPPTGEYCFIDLDHVRNPQNGEIQLWSMRIVEKLHSYTEISPSGTGLHILGRLHASVPSGGLKRGSIEFYTTGRYTTITGNKLPQTPPDVAQVDVNCLYRLIEANVFDFAGNSKYAALFNNEQWQAHYESQSEADMALCGYLARKLDNVDDIDAAFRLSGLMRAKWDSARGDSTYGRDTILKVLKRRTIDDSPTDLGNAKRLVAQYGQDLLFSHKWNCWLIWDGTRFKIDDSGEIERRAKETVLAMDSSAKQQDEGTLFRWARNSQSRGHLRAMIDLAKTEEGISVRPILLDANPWLLNCKNGTLDLRNGKLREHNRQDLCTKLAPVNFDADALCPQWEKFLKTVMNKNEALICFLQRAVGYSLTGSVQEHVFFIEFGSGRNGKSTFSEVINSVLGDYAATADASLLLIKKSDGPRNDVARLEGKRLVLASEVETGSRLAEGLVKQLTGDDKLCARKLYCEAEEFDSTFKIWLRTNTKPEIRGADNAIWKRIRLIPFEVTIPDEEQDKGLRTKLMAELPGILAWAVRGCLEWQKNGLGTPPEVIAAVETYKKESDVLGDFLEDCCVLAKQREIRSAELYEAYRNYCLHNGMPEKQIVSTGTFGKLLTERGVGTRRDKGHRYRTGIDLNTEIKTAVKPSLHTGVTSMSIHALPELKNKIQ